MISPTPGRVVWYYPSSLCGEAGFARSDDGKPLAAIVAKVWNDRCVNLAVFDANGVAHSRTSVLLIQEGDARPGSSFCEWMPYQKGQAAKQDMAPAVSPLSTLAAALKADPEYAWSWHCCLAMAFVDEGGDHTMGNRAAARFMSLCFGVDTTTHIGFEPHRHVETKAYTDGTTATGVAPLPDQSPEQQRSGELNTEEPDHATAD